MNNYFVYIMVNKRNGTIYIGITNNFIKRVYEHKNDRVEGFSKKYKAHLLVYFEKHGDVNEAISREKKLKRWRRKWKLDLIEKDNPDWNVYKNK